MSYPTTVPKNKHDLLCVQAPSSSSNSSSLEDFENLVENMKVLNSDELFDKVEDSLSPTNIKPTKVASLYSYEDGPKHPGPLSRGLLILGFADQSLDLVRKIVDRYDSAAALPEDLHQCTIAVQLADSRHYDRLEPRHQQNSTQFAKLMITLRQQRSVAILGKDKYGRFGILAPLPKVDGTIMEYSAQDFGAQCYIGDVEKVKQLFSAALTDNHNQLNHPWENNSDEGPTFKSVDNEEETSNGTGGWQPTTPPIPPVEDDTNGFAAPWETSEANENDANGGATMPWETSEELAAQDNGDSGAAAMPWESEGNDEDNDTNNRLPWEIEDTESNSNSNKRSFGEMNGSIDDDDANESADDTFHKNKGAAEADAFYSGLTRSLDTRADSYLYHMRSFNGWVKATQIAELDPRVIINGKVQPKEPLRVLDLACGKGGDLTKWTLHTRGMKHYVGIDVARGSLKDAAERARGMRQKKKLENAIFSCADLGSDVPGRKKTPNSKYLQKLLTWKLEDEALYESAPPEFKMERGGGISETEKFDVVSIQFAIHYMMQTRERARRFFHTVSQLLEIGGLLAFTTIDARVIVDHMMNLGLNYHFEPGKEPEFSEVVVEAGSGACKLKFEPCIVKKILESQSDGSNGDEELFGLEYTFTLVEGSDHAAGVGDAVNLPEWLIPVPVLVALGNEAGLELDYVQNFHEFYNSRRDPNEHAAAHTALYNMKVVNKDGTISKDEWSVSRLYAAMRFRKVRESSMVLEISENDDIDNGEDDEDEEKAPSSPSAEEPDIQLDPEKAKKMYPMAMMKAKKAAGDDWNSLSREEKERLTQLQLRKMIAT
ncbi:mRNA capping enzyme [Nitzschia inconspicua]|uniref:mRNA capping enzyme n=1 Tax=Nitzschia inconspicua TaxID=303405 RepID=A0A9K3KLV4_9STRA|nr:mRNA capping enzyme [Nitzschia inconspicua]